MADVRIELHEGQHVRDSAALKVRAAFESQFFACAKTFAAKALEVSAQGTRSDAEQIQCAMIAILMTSFALEAYINHACRERLPCRRVVYHLKKRFPFKKKWRDVLNEVATTTGATIPVELFAGTSYEQICDLFDLRNRLVHYKTGFLPPTRTQLGNASPMYAEVNASKANEYVAAAEAQLRAAVKITAVAFPFEPAIISQGRASISGGARIVPAPEEEREPPTDAE